MKYSLTKTHCIRGLSAKISGGKMAVPPPPIHFVTGGYDIDSLTRMHKSAIP